MNVIVFHPDDELCRMLESEMVRQPDVTVLPASYEELADSGLLDGAAVDCRMENGCLCFRVPPSLHDARALSYALA